MRKVLAVLLLVLSLTAPAQQRAVSRADDAPGRVQRYIDIVMTGSALKGSSVGVVAVKANGTLDLKSSGMASLKGSLLKLN